mmetsp:Transcript_9471/g.22507  ORF Transcript_9471/g.22507 Transcript_9471/m.22507 type:complete len:92 (-) Transcript_9471:80-355(-)
MGMFRQEPGAHSPDTLAAAAGESGVATMRGAARAVRARRGALTAAVDARRPSGAAPVTTGQLYSVLLKLAKKKKLSRDRDIFALVLKALKL